MFVWTDKLIELINAISEFIDEENHAYRTINHICEDARIMAAKMPSGTIDSNTLKMKNAANTRQCSMNIHVFCHGLESFAQVERQYTNSTRETINEIRIFFQNWIKTFDSSEYFGRD